MSMPPLAKDFDYVELEGHDDCFRILDIHPGQRDDPLNCTLRHERREEPPNPKYVALSYTWGSPEKTRNIIVNDQSFKVTANLDDALHGLRDESKVINLWADAICVNQTDLPEKNYQVERMQKVYAGSTSVVIWLGNASEDSDRAIGFIESLCAQLEQHGIMADPNLDPTKYVANDFESALGALLGKAREDDWEAVAKLLMRPWWGRAWIVQELVSAKTANFRCGQKNIRWALLSLTIAVLAHCDLPITRFPHPFRVSCAMDRAWSLMYINHDFANKGSIDFLRLLDHRRRGCTDERDKIYSIVGMIDDEIRTHLKPDYAKPVGEVWASALALDIRQNQDLEVLSFVDHDVTPNERPSWVADLSRAPNTWRFFKFWPPPPIYAWEGTQPITFSEDFLSLHVDGYMIDVIEDARVQRSEEKFTRGLSSDADDWSWKIEEMVARLASNGPLRTSQGINDAGTPEDVKKSVRKVLYETLISGQLSTSMGWVQHAVRYPGELATIVESVETQLGKDVAPAAGPKLTYPKSRHIGLAPSSGAKAPVAEEEPTGPSDKPLEWENILTQAQNQTLGRTVLLSKDRYLGIGPTITQPGDCIFVLHGIREATVLRPREDGTYMFVGTAWFNGFMAGQNRKAFEAGQFKNVKVMLR